MKLEYGSTVLGDDTTGDKIVDHGGENSRAIQSTPLLGGAQPFLAGRGNHGNSRSFTVEKMHSDEKAAVEWWNTHPDSLDDAAVLRVSQGTFACETAAVLASVSRGRLDGKSTLLTYNFVTKQIAVAV